MISLLFISLIFLAAGFIQGFSGFGSALFAIPLLTLFLDVKIAVPLCILNSILITSYLSLELKGYMEKKKILPLFLGSLPGIYIGAIFLNHMESAILKLLLGLLIIIYAVYSLIFHPAPRNIHNIWAYIAGLCTGFIGSAFSAGGPPVIIYTSLTDWSKNQIKATLTGFFLLASIVTAAVHAAGGLTNEVVIKYFLASFFFILVGVYAGAQFYRRISSREYIKVILFTLIVLGAIMVVSAL
jgi:uncharacterized membrane protein YfcA